MCWRIVITRRHITRSEPNSNAGLDMQHQTDCARGIASDSRDLFEASQIPSGGPGMANMPGKRSYILAPPGSLSTNAGQLLDLSSTNHQTHPPPKANPAALRSSPDITIQKATMSNPQPPSSTPSPHSIRPPPPPPVHSAHAVPSPPPLPPFYTPPCPRPHLTNLTPPPPRSTSTSSPSSKPPSSRPSTTPTPPTPSTGPPPPRSKPWASGSRNYGRSLARGSRSVRRRGWGSWWRGRLVPRIGVVWCGVMGCGRGRLLGGEGASARRNMGNGR